jgi:hypothetical protein
LRPLTPFVYPDFTQELGARVLRSRGVPLDVYGAPHEVAEACRARLRIESLDREKCDGAERSLGIVAWRHWHRLHPAGRKPDHAPALLGCFHLAGLKGPVDAGRIWDRLVGRQEDGELFRRHRVGDPELRLRSVVPTAERESCRIAVFSEGFSLYSRKTAAVCPGPSCTIRLTTASRDA